MSNWRERMQKNKEAEEIKQNLERIKKYEVNDVSFPSLATGDVWSSAPAGGAGGPRTMPLSDNTRSFATMAQSWKDKEETDRLEKERLVREAEEKNKYDRSSHHFFNHSIFGASRSREDDTYYEEEYATTYPPTETVIDDGWRTQERKVRRRREDRPTYDMAVNEDLNTWDQPPPEDY